MCERTPDRKIKPSTRAQTSTHARERPTHELNQARHTPSDQRSKSSMDKDTNNSAINSRPAGGVIESAHASINPSMHPSTQATLKYFVFAHLPEGPLQEISRPFCELAHSMANQLEGPELTACLRL